MPTRDIIVIGASAGGVEALSSLARQLPSDLPAAVFVVLHMTPSSESALPHILSRAGALPAVHPEDRDLIERGRIYVAPPDQHLLVYRDQIRLSVTVHTWGDGLDQNEIALACRRQSGGCARHQIG